MASPIRQAGKIVREADRLSASFAREVGRVLREAERRLIRLLGDADEGRQVVSATHAQATRVAIRRILRDAGYDDIADTATGFRLDMVASRVLAEREVPIAVRARLEAMKSIHYLDLLEEGETVATQLWRAVIRGTFSTRPVPELVEEVARVLDISEARIQTLYDTAVSIYGRQVEGEAAGDDADTAFAYMGPVDEKTRDFCLDRVGKVFTRAEIDEMDNGQIANVFLTGGGYNCRHVFMEVSRFSEGRDLIGTDERFPEVQEDIDALKEAA